MEFVTPWVCLNFSKYSRFRQMFQDAFGAFLPQLKHLFILDNNLY